MKSLIRSLTLSLSTGICLLSACSNDLPGQPQATPEPGMSAAPQAGLPKPTSPFAEPGKVPNPNIPGSLDPKQPPVKPIEVPSGLPVPQNGQIAYLSNRDKPATHPGSAGVDNGDPQNHPQVVSVYLFKNGQSRRMSTQTMLGNANLSHRFMPGGQYLGYLIPQGAPNRLALFRQSLDFSQLDATGLPIGAVVANTLPMQNMAINVYPRWAITLKGVMAVIKQTSPTGSDTDVWLGKSNGTDLVKVTASSSFYDELDFSPDGFDLLYTDYRQQGDVFSRIFHLSPGSSAASALNIPFSASQGQWSPDGKTILFSGQDPSGDGKQHLYTVKPDGTQLKQITSGPAGEAYAQWSPDGSKVVYSSLEGAPDPACLSGDPLDPAAQTARNACISKGEDIFSVNADGSNPVNLTKSQVQSQDTYPVWSPDGAKIAFTSLRDGNREVYVMNADGSNPQNISRNPADDSRPVWGP